MNMKNRSSMISKLLASCVAACLMLGAMPVSAFAVTQSQIDALASQRNEITQRKNAQQAVVDDLYAQQADVLEQKRALDERNVYTLEQMRLNEEEIQLYSDMIAEKAQEVEDALAIEQEQLERYRVRVRAMEESGSYNILALILKSNNLGELLTTIDDVGEIMESDRALEDAYIAARINVQSVKAEYEATKKDLEAKQKVLQDEQTRLEAELEEADKLIQALTEDINKNSEVLERIEAEEDAANAEINALIAELEAQKRREEEEKRRQEEANKPSGGNNSSSNDNGGSSGGEEYYGGGGGNVGSGNFGWPVSCTYITSCVGYRYHPITGAWKYHAGMDIGASYGSTVWASDSGVVSLSGWNGGYGECVIIDHRNGYYTLYGHLSSRAVYEGQEINQGDVVGYVGSTGNSTGPHLHFEIRDGGGAIDFNGWFSGLTYAPDSGG